MITSIVVGSRLILVNLPVTIIINLRYVFQRTESFFVKAKQVTFASNCLLINYLEVCPPVVEPS